MPEFHGAMSGVINTCCSMIGGYIGTGYVVLRTCGGCENCTDLGLGRLGCGGCAAVPVPGAPWYRPVTGRAGGKGSLAFLTSGCLGAEEEIEKED